MRFSRSPRNTSRATPSERLIRRTTIGLAIMSLALIAALLAGVGLVTAAVAVQTTDQAVDRSLRNAATTVLGTLEQQATEPDDAATSDPNLVNGEGTDDGEGNDPSVPPTVAPTPTPTVTPAPTSALAGGPLEADDHPPESSDTFFLVLDPAGTITANPQRVLLPGLPDESAASAAALGGEDWRTSSYGGVRVRLLSQRVVDSSGATVAILQSGFVLTLHDEQTGQILMTISLASFIGLLGAALVTFLITRRALAPIRSAFAAERRFVASASHELRTPVAVVRASAEILQREDLVKPDGHKLLEDIVSESDRLGRLVGDLLALASSEAGAITVESRAIEVRGFVAELARRVAGMASARGVRIEVVQDGDGKPGDSQLTVTADPDRMTQLLLIFVDNAIDHSPPGGVVRMVVRPTVEGGRAQVSIGVADQGPGVPSAERSRIFEPFARLAGRRRQTGNTGLGLAIARVLAFRQGATLHVDDAVGGGAVFSVRLPRSLQAEAVSPA